MSRYDDFEHLFQELEMEKRFREGIEQANSDMEKNISDLEAYLRHLDDCSAAADDNEWKARYENQTTLNVHLSDLKGWHEGELAELRWKCHTGSYPDAMNFNLDLLTEYELVRLVKHLERLVNECYTTMRDTEYKLDKESKEFQELDELRRTYKSDVKHCKQTVERLKLEEMIERRAAAGSPSLYSSNYMKWLDENALDDPPAPKTSKSKGKKSLSKSSSSKGNEKDSKDAGGEAEDAAEGNAGEEKGSGEGSGGTEENKVEEEKK